MFRYCRRSRSRLLLIYYEDPKDRVRRRPLDSRRDRATVRVFTDSFGNIPSFRGPGRSTRSYLGPERRDVQGIRSINLFQPTRWGQKSSQLATGPDTRASGLEHHRRAESEGGSFFRSKSFRREPNPKNVSNAHPTGLGGRDGRYSVGARESDVHLRLSRLGSPHPSGKRPCLGDRNSSRHPGRGNRLAATDSPSRWKRKFPGDFANDNRDPWDRAPDTIQRPHTKELFQ